MQINSLQ
jgi:hypothetical protein